MRFELHWIWGVNLTGYGVYAALHEEDPSTLSFERDKGYKDLHWVGAG